MRQNTQPGSSDEALALLFAPCDGCDWDFASGEGPTPCGRYFCPLIPEPIDVRCPTCLFNFATGASNSQCGEVHTCRFSREHAPHRVELFRSWLELHSRPRENGTARDSIVR
jgi:hypothetical protein